jgi:hypothetical protein
MGDCRWLEEGRESVWSSGWFHRYAMCMVITTGLQTGNAVTKLPKVILESVVHLWFMVLHTGAVHQVIWTAIRVDNP